MTTSRKVVVSISLLVFFLTVGLILLLFVYTGPRIWALLVFLLYLFILRFLLFTCNKLVKELRKIEEKREK